MGTKDFDWDYILDGIICSCYWTEPCQPPVLACPIPEIHQLEFLLPLFDKDGPNLVNEVGMFAYTTIQDSRWVKQLTPRALNLLEGFSPPIPVWLTWDYDKYDAYFWLLDSAGWYD